MNKIKSNKGSAMVLLIFIISIVIMLGSTLMSTTMTEYKLSKKDTVSKNNFYSSESGLDEIQAITLKVYDDSFKDSKVFLYALNDALVDYSNNIAPSPVYHNDGNAYNFVEYDSILMHPDYSLALDNEFKKYFNSGFLSYYSSYLKENQVEYDESLLICTIGDILPKIKLNSIPSFSNNMLILNISSSYLENGISRTTSTSLIVESPAISTDITETSVYTESNPYNPLLERPLIVQGNLYLKGNIEIFGDLIVFGDLIAEEDFNLDMKGYNLSVYGDYTDNSHSVSLTDVAELNMSISETFKNTIAPTTWHNDKTSDEFISAIFGLGSYTLGGSLTTYMQEAYKNIGKIPKSLNTKDYNSINLELIQDDEVQPLQILYDISSMNKSYDFFEYNNIYYTSTSSNQNDKSIYIYGYPYQGEKSNKPYYISEKGTTIVVDGNEPSSVKKDYDYETLEANIGMLKGVFIATGDINVTGSIEIEGSLLAFDDVHLDAEDTGSIILKNTESSNLTKSVYDSDDKAALDLESAFKPALDYIDELPSYKTINEITDPTNDYLIKRTNWRVSYE